MALISIHAPRTGSDCPPSLPGQTDRHFNPRSPHGERRMLETLKARSSHFNPRSPHGERRRLPSRRRWTVKLFQSTLPARGATPRVVVLLLLLLISIHAPRTGSDVLAPQVALIFPISIHAPRTGSDKGGKGNACDS